MPDLQQVAQSDVAIKSTNVLNCQTSHSSSQHSCFAFRGPTLQAVQTVHFNAFPQSLQATLGLYLKLGYGHSSSLSTNRITIQSYL